jgi:hypothetical protein
MFLTKEPLINVMSEGQTRQKLTKKRSLLGVNEHFEAIFNAVWPSAIVNQRVSKLMLFS